MEYQARTFAIPELTNISTQTIEEHLGLYAGYVKHVNHIKATLKTTDDAYARAELQRRLGFEWGGMKNHEAYFAQFEGGAAALPDGTLKEKIDFQWGSFEAFMEQFTSVALTRGVGWAMCYLDQSTEQLVIAWVDEQHLGQLAEGKIILALDMWEHSYMLDYPPSQKKAYIDAFFANLNWNVVADRLN